MTLWHQGQARILGDPAVKAHPLLHSDLSLPVTSCESFLTFPPPAVSPPQCMGLVSPEKHFPGLYDRAGNQERIPRPWLQCWLRPHRGSRGHWGQGGTLTHQLPTQCPPWCRPCEFTWDIKGELPFSQHPVKGLPQPCLAEWLSRHDSAHQVPLM